MKRILRILAALLLLLAICPGFTALAAEEDTLPLVTDAADLLRDSDAEELDRRAGELTEQYGIAVRILTVESIGSYDVESFAEAVFDQYDLGFGPEDSCIMLLLSMEYRDYDIFAHGYGNYAFTDHGKAKIAEHVVPMLSDGDWSGAFLAFLEDCDAYLARAAQGSPVDVGSDIEAPGSAGDAGSGAAVRQQTVMDSLLTRCKEVLSLIWMILRITGLL